MAVVAEALEVPPDYVLDESITFLEATMAGRPAPVPTAAGTAARTQEQPADVLDLALLDEADRTMIVAMHAVMARRAVRMAAWTQPDTTTRKERRMTEERTKTVETLIAENGIWGSHATWPVQDWKYEVDNDDTRLGYWEWVAHRIEEQGEDASTED